VVQDVVDRDAEGLDPLADDEPTEAGVREADALLERLGIARSDLLEGAYLDL
jgi:hypothetical protein